MSAIRSFHGIKRYLLFGGMLLALGLLLKACEDLPESSFTLASESRLPKWITLPSGLTRTNVSVTMNYYLFPSSYASFTLQDAKGKEIQKENGEDKCGAGFQLKDPPQGFPPGYPAYKPITVNGITEIVEHRKMEPIFYITDDTTVWKQYRELGCR
ncbi:hypothetical protein [Tunturiibacter lichenicola]|uniref:hypothetical protein n=1 Tax=Tunturiibacter lichenicola TaxID=2051959 RepID=UPI0021B46259|nr:hypothetical protein [Edaphobacter lichenicola]